MIGPVLEFSDLQEMCSKGKKPRLTTVVRWAERNGIKFNYGTGGIWTTVDALNDSLGLTAANGEQYNPEKVL